MQKWEYIVLQIGYPTQEGGGYVKRVNGKVHPNWGKNAVKIYDALNELGQEGWELVAIEMRGALSLGRSSLCIETTYPIA